MPGESEEMPEEIMEIRENKENASRIRNHYN